MLKFIYLLLAIIFEVIATISLKLSNGYTQITPTIVMAISYIVCFYFLSKCLNEFISIGYVYAIWAGLGIVLITLLGVIFFKNVVDIPGVIGISLIVLGAPNTINDIPITPGISTTFLKNITPSKVIKTIPKPAQIA